MTTGFIPTARFDNMRDFTTTTLHGFVGEIRADVVENVERALKEAEAAVREGRW